MKAYERPMLLEQDELTESVFMASGGPGPGGDTGGETAAQPQCKSIYRNGVYKPINWNAATNDDLGCQGCPASGAGEQNRCAIDQAVDPDLDYRPSFEQNGRRPEDPAWGW